MGCFLPAFNPDVWPPSNPSRRGTVATGSARGLKTWPTGCRLWHKGLFLPAFNPDVWPPSNPSRRGKVATGSARGLKTWLFTVSGRLWHNGLCFNACHSGRLAALKPSPAGYGCHWLQALAQWAVFYRLSIRTFGRPQTLPGGVRLPLALLGASKLGFSPFPAGSGTMGCVLTAFTPDVWPPSNPSRRGTVATGSAGGLKTWPTGCRLWHKGLFFTGFQSGRLAALKPFPAG